MGALKRGSKLILFKHPLIEMGAHLSDEGGGVDAHADVAVHGVDVLVDWRHGCLQEGVCCQRTPCMHVTY